eukprot:902808-Pyramimonas_sp.AAC.1
MQAPPAHRTMVASAKTGQIFPTAILMSTRAILIGKLVMVGWPCRRKLVFARLGNFQRADLGRFKRPRAQFCLIRRPRFLRGPWGTIVLGPQPMAW